MPACPYEPGMEFLQSILLSLSLVSAAPEQAVQHKTLNNADIGLAMEAPTELLPRIKPYFSYWSRYLAGAQSRVQLKVGTKATPQLKANLDLNQLYRHWLRNKSHLKERNVLYRLGLNRARRIGFVGSKGGLGAASLVLEGSRESKLHSVFAAEAQVPLWRPKLAAGELYGNFAVHPDQLWLLLERLAGGLYAMETTLLSTNLKAIEQRLGISLLQQALGSEVRELWLWQVLHAEKPLWALKLGVKDGLAAQKIFQPFLLLLPAFMPELKVKAMADRVLRISRGNKKNSTLYIGFGQDGIFMATTKERLRAMQRTGQGEPLQLSSGEVGEGAFRPNREMLHFWGAPQQRFWRLRFRDDQFLVDFAPVDGRSSKRVL